jgi:lysophospholipase L1-like esterase
MPRWLLFGDSLIETSTEVVISDISQMCFPGLTVQNVLDSEKLQDINSLSLYLEQIYGVIICLGTNDLGQGQSVGKVVDDLLKVYQICRDNGVERIVGTFLNVFNAEMFNAELEKQCGDDVIFFEFFLTCTSDDLQPDKLHLNKHGKQRLAEEILHFLERTSKSR